jgi:hypothetical protein
MSRSGLPSSSKLRCDSHREAPRDASAVPVLLCDGVVLLFMFETLDGRTDQNGQARASTMARRDVPSYFARTEETPVAASLPDANTRWRCGGCGNLTRFDVTRTRRTTEFWHFDLAGDFEVEESTTQSEDVGSVTCRWCGRSDAIEFVNRTEANATSP